MLDNAGVRFPVLAAWVAVVVELVVVDWPLVGLFSRIWDSASPSPWGVALRWTSWPVT